MGIDTINKWVVKFGAGSKTGIDLPGEIRGSIPDREWKKRIRPDDPQWKDFDTVMASIGQGSVAITPIQLLRAQSGILMGGQFRTPHLLKEARDTLNSKETPYDDRTAINLNLSAETVKVISYGMWGVVNEGGTASSVGFPRSFNIGGKTGTAQVIAKEKARLKEHKDHAWFISFSPLHSDQKTEIGIVVLTEHGGFGAKASGPKAREIYDAYFAKKEGRILPEETIAKNEKDIPLVELGTKPNGTRKAKRSTGNKNQADR
jgi:penicillin-binding protein 2